MRSTRGGSSLRPSLFSPVFKTPETVEMMDEKYRRIDPEAENQAGKFGEVWRVESVQSPGNPVYVLKQQLVKSPSNPRNTVYRELRVLRFLQEKLGDSSGFVKLRGYSKTLSRKVFLNMILEDAGRETFRSRGSLTMSEFRSVCFQIIFALHQAQRLCQFVHNDLHLDNVALKADQTERTYELDGTTRKVWKTKGLVAKIIDFGHSRVTLDSGEEICNPKDPSRQAFSPTADTEKLFMELRGFTISDLHLCDPSEVSLKSDFVNSLKSKSPFVLVHHPFFSPLLSLSPSSSSPTPVPSLSSFLSSLPSSPLAKIEAKIEDENEVMNEERKTPRKTKEETKVEYRTRSKTRKDDGKEKGTKTKKKGREGREKISSSRRSKTIKPNVVPKPDSRTTSIRGPSSATATTIVTTSTTATPSRTRSSRTLKSNL